MEEQLISYETAKLAKEKGFDWKVISHYDIEHKELIENSTISLLSKENIGKYLKSTYNIGYDFNSDKISNSYQISAPTQSLLQKWLREKHNIHICVGGNYYHENITGYSLQIKGLVYKEEFKTYEEALESGLLEALKLIK